MESFKYKIGDVVFFSYDSIFTKLIRFYNYINYGFKKENRWSHIGIISDIYNDKVIIYEALDDGFTRVEYDKKYLKRIYDKGIAVFGRYSKKIKEKQVKLICEKYKGIKYSWFDVIRLGLSLFLKNNIIKNIRTKNLICSEAICKIYYDLTKKKVNFEKILNKNYDLITPIDIYLSNVFDIK